MNLSFQIWKLVASKIQYKYIWNPWNTRQISRLQKPLANSISSQLFTIKCDLLGELYLIFALQCFPF